jgi:hypothetical protein
MADFLGVLPILLKSSEVFNLIMKNEKSPSIANAELMVEAELKYIGGFLGLVILIAIFGASVTFPLILVPINEPADPSNLSTVNTLLAVSWSLFVVGALLACSAAGNFYSRGYMKAVINARNAAKKAQHPPAQNVSTEEIPDSSHPTQQSVPPEGENISHELSRQVEEIVTAVNRGRSWFSPRAIEKLRVAELTHIAIKYESQKAVEKNQHLAAEHKTRQLAECLAAARLAAERQKAAENARLVDALLAAENAHLEAEERARLDAQEAIRLAEENKTRMDSAHQTATILANARSVAEKRTALTQSKSRLFTWILYGLNDFPGDGTGYESILTVLLPIGSALICLCVVVEMYVRTIGIVAIVFVGLLVWSLLFSSSAIGFLSQLRGYQGSGTAVGRPVAARQLSGGIV